MISQRNINNLPLDIRKHFAFTSNNICKVSGLSVVIPARGVQRQPNINYVISRILLQNIDPIEIIVSEEDQRPSIVLDKFHKDGRIKKIFTLGKKDKFNKSVAINVGVIHSKYKKILMNDADIVLPVNYLSRMDKCLDEYESFFVAQKIFNVNLNKHMIAWSGSKREDYFSGGSVGFTKDAFMKIGGMCEKFEGYGSEDCEFFERLKKCTNLFEQRDTCLLHINHKRENAFSVNTKLYDELVSLPMEIRLEKLKIDLQERIASCLK